MDEVESSVLKNRKRTESNGGSSDSELSEGWNIIDQTDVTNHDVPSSDGESVEVIDGEDESRGNVTDTEVEGDSQLSPATDTPLVSTTESDTPAVPQEEMFDSSFCWFLLFATAAVLISNLAFMLAENAFDWNMDSNIEAPSFLRDLPTTPKLMDGNNIIQNIPWVEKEDAVVEIVDDHVTKRDSSSKYDKRSQRYEMKRNQPYKQPVEKYEKHSNEINNKKPYEKFNKQSHERFNKERSEKYSKQQSGKKFEQNENGEFYKQLNDESQKDSVNFDDHEIGRYFNTLNEVTKSAETREKLNQVLLILDALYIGLNDLEEVVTENSELHDVLKKQKHKLSQVLTEMEYGVSKSLDRVASTMLNKVRKLERRFENQWCQLEKHGHQEELRGLFYDCQENEDKAQSNHYTDSKHSEQSKDQTKEDPKIDLNWNSYQYQVDKDSPGKEHGNSHIDEAEEVDEYYKLVRSDVQDNVEVSEEQVNDRHISNNEANDFVSAEKNDKEKYTDDKRKIFDDRNDKRKFTDHKGKQYDNKGKQYDDKGKYYDDKGTHYNNKRKYDDKEKHHDGQENHYDKKGKHDGKVNHYEDKGTHYKDKEKHDSRKYYDDKVKSDYDSKNHAEKEWHDKGNHYDDKGNHYDDKEKHDNKGKHYNSKKEHIDNEQESFGNNRKHDGRSTSSENKKEHTKKFDTYKTYKSIEQNQNKDQTNKREQSKSGKYFANNSGPELLSKYLKESCEKGKNKLNNMYEKLKSFIDSKLKVPHKMFDALFTKYCRVNDDSYKWEKRFNREHPKGDFSGKNDKNFVKEDFIIEDNLNNNNNVRIVDISEVSPEDEATDPASDNIIKPNNQPRQWVFSYEESLHDNRSNLTGYWFFKAGQSRSKMRWSHHRGDWWFERASHRRTHPRPPNWFSGRRKNWYFRRAWARQNCRHSPNDDLCDFSEDETVTIPNPNFNFR